MHLKGKDWAFEASRDCITSIPGVKFRDMVRNRALAEVLWCRWRSESRYSRLGIWTAPRLVSKMATEVQAEVIASTCPFCRRNMMDGRNDAKSSIKMLDVVELMAASMGLDTTIPENPYTKYPGTGCLGLHTN